MTVAVAFDYARAEKEAVGCPLCGAMQPSRTETDRFGYSVGVSECCDLEYLNPRMTAAEYGRFYREVYRPLLADRYGADQLDSPREHEFAVRRGVQIGWLLRDAERPVRSLVDAGGDTGIAALSAAAVLGCRDDVTVIDPNADALTEAKRRGCKTIEGLIDHLPLPDRQWDAAQCLLTADHWLNPLAALRWLRAAVVDGGRLWIDIVDARKYARKYRNAPRWKVDHPLYWTTASFQRALAQTGWAVVGVYVTQANKRCKVERPGFLCVGV